MARDVRVAQRFGEPCTVVVVSYEVLRHDVAAFSAQPFLYCVLDEGHIIRNPAAKLTLAVKAVRADHRLVLSGTPTATFATGPFPYRR